MLVVRERHRRKCRKRLAILAVIGACLINSRRMWVRPIFQRRGQHGENNLVKEMRDDLEKFHQYFRMNPQTFDILLSEVEPLITKITTNWREPISAAERLAITLRYLATGDSKSTISLSFSVGHSTVSQIIRETCAALWDVLQPQYMSMPGSASEWTALSARFEERWNFPNCLGALDGKHVAIQAPPNAGSEFYNYKGYHSIILLALADADYMFTAVDIGDSGRHSDGGVFSNSTLGGAFMNNRLDLPADRLFQGANMTLPYCIVADAAFPLRRNMMRPFPGRNLSIAQKIFNYRLSRARRVVENSFGILCARWRVFRRSIVADRENAVSVVKAACCLHNFMQARGRLCPLVRESYCPESFLDREDAAGNVIPGNWRVEVSLLRPVGRIGSNRYAHSAWMVRENFKEYFMSRNGEVSWQLERVCRRSDKATAS